MTETRYVQSLDGIRAFAIGAVMMVHANAPGFQAGWIGVDLFFALSGFLITTLLLNEYQKSGKISYGDFLVRRGLRLMPAYVIYVAILTYGIWGWTGSIRTDHGGWTATDYTIALWAYFVNFAPMGGIWNGQEIAIHLWSLAVEQQYYLIWPLVVLALVAQPRKLLLTGVCITIFTVVLFYLTPDGLAKSSWLPTRGFTLVLASTSAIAAYQYKPLLSRLPWLFINVTGGMLVVSVFAVSASGLLSEQAVRANFLLPVSIYFVLWIISLWYLPLSEKIKPLILNPAIQYIGKVSYGVYLYHELVRALVWYFTKPLMAAWPQSLGYVGRLSLYVALSIVIASLSYEFIERRFLRLRVLFKS